MMIVTLDVANAQAKRVCICICRVHAFSAGDLHGVCMVMWLLCGEFEVRERLVRVMGDGMLGGPADRVAIVWSSLVCTSGRHRANERTTSLADLWKTYDSYPFFVT